MAFAEEVKSRLALSLSASEIALLKVKWGKSLNLSLPTLSLRKMIVATSELATSTAKMKAVE